MSQVLGASPTLCASASTICRYYNISYAHKSAYTSGHYVHRIHTWYCKDTVKFGNIQCSISLVLQWQQTRVKTPTVREILGLKLKCLWSEIGQQNLRTECYIDQYNMDRQQVFTVPTML